MKPNEQNVEAEMTDEQFRQHALKTLQRTLGAGGFGGWPISDHPKMNGCPRSRFWDLGIYEPQPARFINRRINAPRRIQTKLERVRYYGPEMAHTPRVYLDACALNRLTDDPCQPRIAMEAAAMIHLLRMVRTGRVNWVASSILKLELKRNPNTLRRDYSLELLRQAAEIRSVNQEVANRARVLNSIGYGKFDAYHLALAEFAKTDILLTTDDRFVRQARRGLGTPTVLVQNPLDYLQEVKP